MLMENRPHPGGVAALRGQYRAVCGELCAAVSLFGAMLGNGCIHSLAQSPDGCGGSRPSGGGTFLEEGDDALFRPLGGLAG